MTTRNWRSWVAIVLGLGIAGGIALWPVQTFRRVNLERSGRTIRLYEKAVDFISRDLQTRRLVQDIAGKVQPGEATALVIFKWVTEHVRPTPEGFPVIDDHPLHIIIRGYGAPDQRTEAFELLSSYAGMASTRIRLKNPQDTDYFDIALTEIHGTLFAFDVVHNVIFRDGEGALIPAERLMNNSLLIRTAAGGMEINGVPYEDFFSGQKVAANFSRMEMQKPLSRLRIEAARLIGANPTR